MRHLHSLRTLTLSLILSAFCSGALSVFLWMQSNSAWRDHQSKAYTAGLTFYYALQRGNAFSDELRTVPLSPDDRAAANAGEFQQLSNAPRAARITLVPITAEVDRGRAEAALTLAILSPDLLYRIADLSLSEKQSAAETTGEVFRLLSSLCSDPMVIAKVGQNPWVQVYGAPIWGCDMAPADRRLLAALLVVLAFAVSITVSLNLSSDFTNFADQLRKRRRIGGPARYDIQGPQELQDIVAAVNEHLMAERAQLEGRAAVLSGVSHDLGTPATRLRLRTALIEDQDLRHKLEADIDSMTGMIESVLTYTRAEMNAEDPRRLSLNALIEAVVANYEDMGRAVSYRQPEDVIVQGGRSVFMSRQGQTVVTQERAITIIGRPISLERAMTNLIDNALKYGRRATVSLQTNAETATIIVEDEGSDSSAEDIAALMAPFRRGNNTATIEGYGLGLTIVATIAKLHGGSLTFEDTSSGLSARLMIERG